MAAERIVSIVLAAGAGRRFGGRKQLGDRHLGSELGDPVDVDTPEQLARLQGG